MKTKTPTLVKIFSEIEDPRVDWTKRHKLIDIIVIAICAVLCGANDWVNVELFGEAKKEWLQKILELPNGIPSHDTFGRVFAKIDATQFETCFMNWIQSIQTPGPFARRVNITGPGLNNCYCCQCNDQA